MVPIPGTAMRRARATVMALGFLLAALAVAEEGQVMVLGTVRMAALVSQWGSTNDGSW